MNSLQYAALFTQKCHNLLSQGIGLQNTITALLNDEKNPIYKTKIKTIKYQLEQGIPFLKTLHHILPPHSLIHLENLDITPSLTPFLKDISDYFDQKHALLKQNITNAIYPLTLLASTISIIIIITTAILPTYADFFKGLNITLPLSLSIILKCTKWLSTYKLPLLLLTTTLTLLTLSPIKKYLTHKTHQFLFPIQTSDLLWTLSILLKQGTPLPTALAALTPSNTHPHFKPYMQTLKDIEKTGQVSTSFCTHFPLPDYLKTLLIHSEKHGNFNQTLQLVGKELQQLEQDTFKRKINRSKPILLTILSLIIFATTYLLFIPLLSGLEKIL